VGKNDAALSLRLASGRNVIVAADLKYKNTIHMKIGLKYGIRFARPISD